jgi:hypothetical protein
MVVPFTDDNIVERIKSVIGTDPIQERRDVYSWCKERMESVAVCDRILGSLRQGNSMQDSPNCGTGPMSSPSRCCPWEEKADATVPASEGN